MEGYEGSMYEDDSQLTQEVRGSGDAESQEMLMAA